VNQQQPTKVMIIGLDCAEPSLVLEEWRDELPAISRLLDNGVYGRLTSVIPPITVPAHTSRTTRDRTTPTMRATGCS